MYIRTLKLLNFKNYPELEASFCSNVNCLVGNNGVGKTNLLDALYYLSFSKSYFNAIDKDNIRQGEDCFAIHGMYEGDVAVSCVVRRDQGKQLKYNGRVCKTFAEHVGKIPLVMVSPIDQMLITGGSDMRRKFMDGVISQTDKDYLQQLLRYQKALEQRNRLLKQMAEDHYVEEEMLEVWDEQLSLYGEYLKERRGTFLKDFTPLFSYYYNWIVNDGDVAGLTYETQLVAGEMKELMKQRRSDDLRNQYTTVGVHKDDLIMTIGNMPAKKYGSQGQQKTLALALKLAQFEYIYAQCGMKPILLLDDIFDKLDMNRVKQLVRLVGSERFGQVFLTDTQPGRVSGIFADIPQVEHRIYEVSADHKLAMTV